MDNPIGTKGAIANAYANLLKNVYNGISATFSPWDFKSVLSNHFNMFMGFQQHDTQEFLNYVLDGLHEDLNKVLIKPPVEKDNTPKADKIKAKEQWIGFLRRNQSVLVELLYGQYKSTLHCPNNACNNISITFDPFLSLTLPIVANADAFDTLCTFIPYDLRSSQIEINIRLNSECTVMALRNKLSKILNVHPFSFFVVKVSSDSLIDQMCNCKMLVRNTTSRVSGYMSMGYSSMTRDSSEHKAKFMIYQLNPKYFYTKNNKFYQDEQNYNITSFGHKESMEERNQEIKKLYGEDYNEDNSGFTEDKIYFYSKRQMQTYLGELHTEYHKMNCDDNMGYDDGWLKVVIAQNQYEYHHKVAQRKNITVQRIMYMHKSWNTKRMHLEIFKYFFNVLVHKDNLKLPKFAKGEELSNEEQETYFVKYFGDDFFPQSESDTVETHEKKKYPYRIRVRSIAREAKNTSCYHCQTRTCHDCLLPFNQEVTLAKLVSLVPKNVNKDTELEIDNNFYYLSTGSQNRMVNKDFSLELTWLDDFRTSVLAVLNEKMQLDFQIQKQKKTNSVTLDDCFKNFMKYEKLEPPNEWYCPQCKQHQKATKQMEIYKAPPILILHLKRFTNQNKLSMFVDYPVKDLDLSEYIKSTEDSDSKLYDLFSVSNHYGGMGGGHYVAYAQNYFNKRWYKFDDSHVQEIDESMVVKDSGYVLFYRRKDVDKLNLDDIYNKSYESYEDLVKKQEESMSPNSTKYSSKMDLDETESKLSKDEKNDEKSSDKESK